MRLIYNRKYQEIDGNISECQMGSRKKKGCKNNIFVLNGIIFFYWELIRLRLVFLFDIGRVDC